MKTRTVVIRVLAVVVATPLAFWLLQSRMRHFETLLAASFFQLIGVHNVITISSTSILIVPYSHQSPFWVELTPACSSLSSLLAMAVLAVLIPRRPGRQRVLGALVAILAIAIGNQIRIDASIAVGLFAGESSLVLFHDWAGSVFGFAYTLGGFVLMLQILLPRRPKQSIQLEPSLIGAQ